MTYPQEPAIGTLGLIITWWLTVNLYWHCATIMQQCNAYIPGSQALHYKYYNCQPHSTGKLKILFTWTINSTNHIWIIKKYKGIQRLPSGWEFCSLTLELMGPFRVGKMEPWCVGCWAGDGVVVPAVGRGDGALLTDEGGDDELCWRWSIELTRLCCCLTACWDNAETSWLPAVTFPPCDADIWIT
jgi:hypothetical protein